MRAHFFQYLCFCFFIFLVLMLLLLQPKLKMLRLVLASNDINLSYIRARTKPRNPLTHMKERNKWHTMERWNESQILFITKKKLCVWRMTHLNSFFGCWIFSAIARHCDVVYYSSTFGHSNHTEVNKNFEQMNNKKNVKRLLKKTLIIGRF